MTFAAQGMRSHGCKMIQESEMAGTAKETASRSMETELSLVMPRKERMTKRTDAETGSASSAAHRIRR